MNDQNAETGPGPRSGHEAPQGSGSGKITRLAWLPIPLLAGVIIAARAAGLSQSYTSETLTLVSSVAFYTLASLGILFLIGRSFLVTGAPGLLLLECGVILWSLAGTVGDAVSHGDANINVTIFNTGILAAAVCHLAGAILSLRPQRVFRARAQWLAAGCALVLGVLWLIAQAALAKRLPVFFIPGQGGTLARYCVLIAAIAMFVLSAGLLLAGRRQARTPFTFWYALALLLLAVGLFGVMIQLSLGSVVNWLGRTAQWLGGVYLLLAAVAALRQSDLPLLPSVDKSRQGRYGYGVAVSIVIAAIAAQFVLSPALGTKTPFLTFYPAVILAALYGGVRAGVLATVFSALVLEFFWMKTVDQVGIGQPTDWVNLLLFFLSCTMISFIVEAMHKARDRLILYQDHLKELVRDRTASLEQEVFERKQAEKALRESEDEYRSLFENLNSAALMIEPILDGDGRLVDLRYLMANPSVEKHLGKTVGELVGKRYSEVFTLPGRNPVFEIYENVLSSGEPFKGEILLPATDKYFEMAVYRPMKGRLALVLSDISDRTRAEAALRESEEQFRQAIEDAPIPVIMHAEDGQVLQISRTWTELTGYTREDVPTFEAWLNRAYGYGADKVRNHVHELFLDSQRSIAIDFPVRTRTGETRYWSFNASSPGTLRDGRRFVVGMAVDITERKRAEERLQRSQETFAELIERAPFGMYVVDAEFRIAHMNASSQNGAFRNVRPVVGRDFAEAMRILWTEPVAAEIIGRFRHTLETGEPYFSPRFTNLRHDVGIVESYEWELHRMRLPDGQHGVICYYYDSTELRNAEAAVRASETKYRLLFDSMTEGFGLHEIILDADGRPCDWRFLELNPAWERQTGIPRATVVGKTMRKVWPDLDSYWLETFGKVALTGEPVRYENYSTPLQRWYETFAFSPKPNHFALVFFDITERKKAEEEVVAAHRQVQSVIDNTTSLVYALDLEDRFLLANTALAELLDSTPEQMIGKRRHELMPKEDADWHEANDRQVIETGRALEFEEYSQLKGRSITWLTTKFPLLDAQGRIYAVGGISADVSERKRMEEELRQSEARFRTLAENNPYIISRYDRQHRYLYLNPSGERTAGLFPRRYLGKSAREMGLPPDLCARWEESQDRAFAGETVKMQFSRMDHEGRERFISDVFVPEFSPDGSVSSVLAISNDVTEIVEAQEALRRSRDELELRVRARTAELEHKTRELQEFAYVASHDLREPLRKIQAFGDLLKAKSGDRLRVEERDYVLRMTGAASRMQELLDALLRYSRVETQARDPVPLKLEEIVQTVTTDLEVSIRKIGADLEIGPLPVIKGDPYQWRQVFQNLIANAIKYHRSEVRPRIRIFSERKGEDYRILVEDNGIGFDEKYLDKIFMPFQRLHGKNEYPGTGIGLAICKKIVERHGGTITAKSTPGKGSTFIATLPSARKEN